MGLIHNRVEIICDECCEKLEIDSGGYYVSSWSSTIDAEKDLNFAIKNLGWKQKDSRILCNNCGE